MSEEKDRLNRDQKAANYDRALEKATKNSAYLHDEEEIEENLYKSLSKARKNALEALRPQNVAQAVADSVRKREAENRVNVNELVFTATSEFVRNLEVAEPKPKKEMFKKPEIATEEHQAQEEEVDIPSDPEMEDVEDPDQDTLEEEPIIGSGLSGALKLLAKKGNS